MYIFYIIVLICFGLVRPVAPVCYEERVDKCYERCLITMDACILTAICIYFLNYELEGVMVYQYSFAPIILACLCFTFTFVLSILCNEYQRRKKIAFEKKRQIVPTIIFACIAGFFFFSLQNYLAIPCPQEIEKIYAQAVDGNKLKLIYGPARRDDGTLSLFAVVNAAEHILPAGPERDRILEAGKDIRESVFWTLLPH